VVLYKEDVVKSKPVGENDLFQGLLDHRVLVFGVPLVAIERPR
jgi:hypothetical protein